MTINKAGKIMNCKKSTACRKRKCKLNYIKELDYYQRITVKITEHFSPISTKIRG